MKNYILILFQFVFVSYRFCFIGDSGIESSKKGYKKYVNKRDRVVQHMDNQSCDRVYVLGDIIYRDGIEDSFDDELKKQFTEPFSLLLDQDIPFHLTMGNHDYMKNPLAWVKLHNVNSIAQSAVDESNKYAAQLSSERPPNLNVNLVFPQLFWEEYLPGGLCVASIDSSPFWETQMKLQKIFSSNSKSSPHQFHFKHFYRMRVQIRDWIKNFFNDKDCKLSIAIAHHPFRSVGGHGNAGDGFFKFGSKYKTFVRRYILGRFDYYFSGHDHNLSYEGDLSCKDSKCTYSCPRCEKYGKEKYCNACHRCQKSFCPYSFKKKTKLVVSGSITTLKDLHKKNISIMRRKVREGQHLFGKKAHGYVELNFDERFDNHDLVFHYLEGDDFKKWRTTDEGQTD